MWDVRSEINASRKPEQRVRQEWSTRTTSAYCRLQFVACVAVGDEANTETGVFTVAYQRSEHHRVGRSGISGGQRQLRPRSRPRPPRRGHARCSLYGSPAKGSSPSSNLAARHPHGHPQDTANAAPRLSRASSVSKLLDSCDARGPTVLHSGLKCAGAAPGVCRLRARWSWSVYDRPGPVCYHPLSSTTHPPCSCQRFNRAEGPIQDFAFDAAVAQCSSWVKVAMLDAVSLSEEELGVLFGPASHGAAGTKLGPTPSRARVSSAPGKHAGKAKRAKTTTAKLSTATGGSSSGVLPARCGYRTGKCQNLQAIKRNGKLHKLCEFHRERANLNQKKLDRKKRMQRSKLSRVAHPTCESLSSASSVTSEDDTRSLDLEDRSPRTVESAVSSSVFVKPEPEPLPDEELSLPPTSLHEAPLVLGCEELAIFCSLMTFDGNHHRAPPRPPVRTPSCHYRTSIV
ncbi:hypothetical protein PHYPSEUDO_004594 [Phytophthora pseudosyringae]|uniref:Uncharacterized protein n=1 Tax=Phytophthora pseudosyringae TaxID=221518 RepID=A0A8T1WGS2_9STRA|nr:hypothetical protein PHYPSEUDO_004594 [Phytophthora pseudosyringae]